LLVLLRPVFWLRGMEDLLEVMVVGGGAVAAA
jgi:hypothetical protein